MNPMSMTADTTPSGTADSGHPWTLIAVAFILSRFLSLLASVLPWIFLHGVGSPGGGMPIRQPWGAAITRSVFQADSGYYMSIVQHGYARVPFSPLHQQNWPFFPLYPWLVRYLGDALGHHYMLTGVLISNAAFLAFLYFLYRWVDAKWGRSKASLSVWLAAFWIDTPDAIAFRAGSLFLMLVMLFFLNLDTGNWRWAMVFGALASLTRPTGLVLAVPYGVWCVQTRPSWATRLVQALLGLPLALGFVVVGILDKLYTGNALAFLEIQYAWNRLRTYPFHYLGHWLLHLSLTDQGGWDFGAVSAGFLALGLVTSWWMYRTRPRDWEGVAYAGLTTVAAASWTSLMGVVRFISQIPHIYAGLALWAAESPVRRQAILLTVASLAMLYSVLWGLGIYAVLS